jgi:hypothetical protein
MCLVFLCILRSKKFLVRTNFWNQIRSDKKVTWSTKGCSTFSYYIYYVRRLQALTFRYKNVTVTKTCQLFDVNINNEQCFSFRYRAYYNYQTGKNICMTHQPGNRHMPSNEKHSSLLK